MDPPDHIIVVVLVRHITIMTTSVSLSLLLTLASSASAFSIASPRRCVVLGGAAALWGAACPPANAGAVPVEELNERRAKIGLPPLDIILSDGTWAQHKGSFEDNFFDSTFKKRNDGFVYKFVNQPEGERPQQGQLVKVYYTGYLKDGTKFDSAYDKGRPFEFRLGKQTVITGWEAIVSGMKVGQKVIAKIPSSFAYGSKSVGLIPPDSDLIFYMELVGLGDKI